MLISDIVVDKALAALLGRMTRILPSFASARTEAHYLGAMSKAGLADIEVRGRFVYEPEHLLGMFGGDGDRDYGSGGLARSTVALKRQALALGARCAAGRVASTKFYARKPGTK
jgi:hypothetical protein